MGLGSARMVSLAEARAKANECAQAACGRDRPARSSQGRTEAARAAELHRATSGSASTAFSTSHGDRWRAKHARQWRKAMATYCKPLDRVAVADIDIAHGPQGHRAGVEARAGDHGPGAPPDR